MTRAVLRRSIIGVSFLMIGRDTPAPERALCDRVLPFSAMRLSTRLCCEPGCSEVLVDAAPGARCAEHRRAPWDRWRAGQPAAKLSGYGYRWARFRAAIIAERGERCEGCGAVN